MTDYRALLSEIAVPRLAGSVSQARLLDPLKRELRARGFAVDEHHFTATTTALAVVAHAGVLLLAAGLAAVALPALGSDERAVAKLTVACGALLGALTAFRRSLLHQLGARVTGAINLVASRSPLPVHVWLVAHYDSKGQAMSMATRLAAGVIGSGALAALMVLAVWELVDGTPSRLAWMAAGVLAAAAGAVLARNHLLRDSPGAVDNATGILTVFAALDRLPPDARVGVILPDAEEWGLVGARALVRERPDLLRHVPVINFDGIDDWGNTIALVHRPGPTVDAVAAALGARRARWLPVVVDGSALAKAAPECVTVMRGGWHTMRVVHTPRDTADRLTLDGVRGVATGVARALSGP